MSGRTASQRRRMSATPQARNSRAPAKPSRRMRRPAWEFSRKSASGRQMMSGALMDDGPERERLLPRVVPDPHLEALGLVLVEGAPAGGVDALLGLLELARLDLLHVHGHLADDGGVLE